MLFVRKQGLDRRMEEDSHTFNSTFFRLVSSNDCGAQKLRRVASPFGRNPRIKMHGREGAKGDTHPHRDLLGKEVPSEIRGNFRRLAEVVSRDEDRVRERNGCHGMTHLGQPDHSIKGVVKAPEGVSQRVLGSSEDIFHRHRERSGAEILHVDRLRPCQRCKTQ